MASTGVLEAVDGHLESVLMTQEQSKLTPEDRVREFEELALPYTKLLYGAAFNKTKNQLDAEDLVQETFAKAFKSWHQFEKGTNLRAWLIRILENTYINLYNKKVKQGINESLDNLEDFQVGDAESITTRVHRSAEAEALERVPSENVKRALRNLKEEYRTVVYLAIVEGLSYSEIAEVIGRPIGTVMSRLHRGKAALHEALEEFAAEEGYDVTPTKEKKAQARAQQAEAKK